jgi:hypothetical protein
MGHILNSSCAAPTQADINLSLIGDERKLGLHSGSITWISSGIDIENEQ